MFATRCDRDPSPSSSNRRPRCGPRFATLAVLPLLVAFDIERDEPTPSSENPEAVADHTVNVHRPSTQEATALARTPEGGAVVVWHSRKQQARGTYGVYARLYDADGGPLTGEVQANATTHTSQTRPAVDTADDGSIWIVWESFEHDGDRGSIVARRFAPDLASATAELLVNGELAAGAELDELRSSGALGHQSQPVVRALADGGAWIAWTTPDDSGRGRIALRRVAADGSRLGASRLLARPDAAQDGYPCLARSGSALVCAFARTDENGVPSAILAQHLTLDGAPQGDPVALSGDSARPVEPALCANDSGRFALAWLDGSGDGEGETYVPRWRTFATGTEFEFDPIRTIDVRHDADRGGWTSGLAIALDGVGRALIAWSRHGGVERQSDVWARRFEALGEPQAAIFRATGTAVGDQGLPVGSGAQRLWLEDDGSYVLAWTGFAGGADSDAAAISFGGRAARASAPEARDDAPAPSVARTAEGTPDDDPWVALDAGATPHRPPVQAIAPTLVGPATLPITAAGGFQAFSQTGLTPPDPELAVGPDHVVAVVNDGLRFFTLDGVQTFSNTISQPGGFFSPSGISNSAFVFDPEALYDPHSGRYMVMANARASGSFFLLSVSDDSNPNGTWFHYAFNVSAAAGNDIDSPNFSVNDSHVFLTADFFSPQDKFLVFVVDKAALLSGGTPQTGFQLINGSQSFGVPIVYDAGAPGYMIESFEQGSNDLVRLWAIEGGTNPTLTSFSLSVPTYFFPEDPPQAGTSVRPEIFEPRFWSTAQRNGSLWATHHQGTPVRQRWYEFDLRGWPTSGQTPVLAQVGDLDPGGELRTFFGSLAVGPAGNVAFTVSRSSPSEFISMYVTSRRSSDPPGFTEPLTLVQASTSADFSGRWGDYSGAAPDPDRPGGFWLHGEFRTDVWRTWLEPLDLGIAPEIYCTPKVSSALCVNLIATSDALAQPTSGAADYSVTCSDVQAQKPGLLFAGGNGPAATPFAGGTLCIAPPLKRGPIAFSGGGGLSTCTGSYTQIVNDGLVLPAGLDAGAGNSGWYQWWYRDPQGGPGSLGSALSNAVRLDFE